MLMISIIMIIMVISLLIIILVIIVNTIEIMNRNSAPPHPLLFGPLAVEARPLEH